MEIWLRHYGGRDRKGYFRWNNLFNNLFEYSRRIEKEKRTERVILSIDDAMTVLEHLFRYLQVKRKRIFLLTGLMWMAIIGIWMLFLSVKFAPISTLLTFEKKAQAFQERMDWGKYLAILSIDAYSKCFSLYRDPNTYEEGIAYSNSVYREHFALFHITNETGIFYKKDFPWEKIPSDRIIDYWIQGFKVSQEKEVFSVCYQFRSGAVLQVADLYDIYGRPADAMHPHKYRVVRMFFVGDRYKERKYRKYFGHAYFETETNIQHYKQLMKEGKGWVRQANRYINEKEVKKEKPILDYRTNPDYYKPLSERKR